MPKTSNSKNLSPQKQRFRGGVYIESEKEMTWGGFSVLRNVPYVDLPIFAREGEAAPCVEEGERVLVGQTLAEDRDTGERLTAPISGKVTFCDALIDGASPVPAIHIENDLLRETVELPPVEEDSRESIMARLEACNVRCGTRPLWKMIERGGGASVLAVTGLDTAPYKSSVRCAAVELADEVVRGMELLRRFMPEARVCVILDRADGQAAGIYEKLLSEKEGFELCPIEARYPYDDRQLLAALFSGRKLGSVTAERGCVVIDAYTAAAAARAVYDGEPDTQRMVTVAGDAIGAPGNVLAPIGAPLSSLVMTCGGYCVQPGRIVSGDPMKGTALYSDSVPLMGNIGAFIGFAQEIKTEKRSCINCGRCAEVCPGGLLPLYLYRFAVSGQDKHYRALRLDECIGCAACDYVCPAELPLAGTFEAVKNERRGEING